MDHVYSQHAINQLKKRNISVDLINDAIKKPDHITAYITSKIEKYYESNL